MPVLQVTTYLLCKPRKRTSPSGTCTGHGEMWHSSKDMTSLPQPHASRRAARVRLPAASPTLIRIHGRQRVSGKLQVLSVTGGLLRLPKPLLPGLMVELMFLTEAGPVLGMAEMLPASLGMLRCLQPFRFISLEQEDYRRLHRAIELLANDSLFAREPQMPRLGTA